MVKVNGGIVGMSKKFNAISNSSMEEVSAVSQELARMSNELEMAVQQFKL